MYLLRLVLSSDVSLTMPSFCHDPMQYYVPLSVPGLRRHKVKSKNILLLNVIVLIPLTPTNAWLLDLLAGVGNSDSEF